jgi:hypothetical protein
VLNGIGANIFCTFSDDSGDWGSGGLFSALDARSMRPEEAYTLAGEMQGIFYQS